VIDLAVAVIIGAALRQDHHVAWLKQRNEMPDTPPLMPGTKNCTWCIGMGLAAAAQHPQNTPMRQTERFE
jgi:hypothetical protein